MNIQFCSDLHLEFADNRRWLEEHPIQPQADILVIAGDTYYLNRTYAKQKFIKKAAKDFEKVYLIPGNHEYYEGFDAAHALTSSRVQLMDNVFMLNNVTEEIEGITFIFTTLWSKIERYPLEILHGMVDFHRIVFHDLPLKITHYNEMHEACLKFLTKALLKKGRKVVVSHHLPSSLCNVEEFKGSPLNEAFCVELSPLIEESDVQAWIFGHSHRNKEDFLIGNTRMLTNQLGYVNWGEHHRFDPAKVEEL